MAIAHSARETNGLIRRSMIKTRIEHIIQYVCMEYSCIIAVVCSITAMALECTILVQFVSFNKSLYTYSKRALSQVLFTSSFVVFPSVSAQYFFEKSNCKDYNSDHFHYHEFWIAHAIDTTRISSSYTSLELLNYGTNF
jgi:hypothetical protein